MSYASMPIQQIPRSSREIIIRCRHERGFATFFFYLKDRYEDTANRSEANMGVWKKKLPGCLSVQEQHMDMGDQKGFIGWITYKLNADGGPTNIHYYPKENASNVRGLGYYLEAFAVHLLQTELGVKRLGKIDSPSDARLSQLEKVGLKAEEMPILEWLAGLGRGIRCAADRYIK